MAVSDSPNHLMLGSTRATVPGVTEDWNDRFRITFPLLSLEGTPNKVRHTTVTQNTVRHTTVTQNTVRHTTVTDNDTQHSETHHSETHHRDRQ